MERALAIAEAYFNDCRTEFYAGSLSQAAREWCDAKHPTIRPHWEKYDFNVLRRRYSDLLNLSINPQDRLKMALLPPTPPDSPDTNRRLSSEDLAKEGALQQPQFFMYHLASLDTAQESANIAVCDVAQASSPHRSNRIAKRKFKSLTKKRTRLVAAVQRTADVETQMQTETRQNDTLNFQFVGHFLYWNSVSQCFVRRARYATATRYAHYSVATLRHPTQNGTVRLRRSVAQSH